MRKDVKKGADYIIHLIAVAVQRRKVSPPYLEDSQRVSLGSPAYSTSFDREPHSARWSVCARLPSETAKPCRW